MAEQIELLNRAAECERLIKLATDPVETGTLKQLHDLWIALASDSTMLSAKRSLVNAIAAIDKVQSGLKPKMQSK